MDVDNIDDVLKLDAKPTAGSVVITWSRSQNGTSGWQTFATYSFPINQAGSIRAFAGRFGAALGGATLVIGPDRRGRFHGITDVTPDWWSLFPY
jgi:hypothetical protein